MLIRPTIGMQPPRECKQNRRDTNAFDRLEFHQCEIKSAAFDSTGLMSFEQYSLGFDRRTSDAPSLGENALWVLFLFSATGGFNVVLTDQLEKAVWLAADIAALATVLGASGLYIAKAKQLWLIFSWPLLALVSVTWSLAPGLTAYHAAQLFMTMLVGLVMQERLGIFRIVILLFVALAIGILASLVVVTLGQSYALSLNGEWKGIFQHKNVLGLSAAMLIYTGILLVKKYWLVVLPILALAITAIVRARSATSLVALCAVIAVIPVILILRLRLHSLAAAGSFLIAGAVLAAGWVLVGDISLVEDLLSALGRDNTLTGRSDLWDFGWQAFLTHPILGLGYKAYWVSDATSAAYLKYFVRQDLWFFHNNWLEVAVGTGLVGLALFILGLVQVIVLVIGANRRTPGIPAAWSLMFLVHVLILCAVENPLFYNHSLQQILFSAIAAAAIKMRDEAERQPAHPFPSMTSAAALRTIARAPH